MPQLEFISLFPIIVGALLLFFGRKVFWLFVGAVAFIAVMTAVPRFVHHQESLVFYIALGVGVIAAGAGWFFQKVAFRLAGFFAGGYIFFTLWDTYSNAGEVSWWLPFLIGGILGAVLLSFLFEWALILLSSVTGAFMVVQNSSLSPTVHIVAIVVLSATGIVVQAKMKRGKSKQNA